VYSSFGSSTGYITYGSGGVYAGFDGTNFVISSTVNFVIGGSGYCSASGGWYVSSDYRLKTNDRPLDPSGVATNRVAAMRPVLYELIENNQTYEGFIAHEIAEVVPTAVVGAKDALNADGTPQIQRVDYMRLVPVMVAAIQELTKRVEALEAQVAALSHV
jgi:hypothetical protein